MGLFTVPFTAKILTELKISDIRNIKKLDHDPLLQKRNYYEAT